MGRDLKNIKGLILIFVILILIFPIIYKVVQYKEPIDTREKENYNIYVVYEPTCPHCHHLFEYLDEIDVGTINIRIPEFRKMKVYRELSRYFKGVPFIFSKVNNSFIIISGFPSKEQDIDGYFYGQYNEIELCKKANGTGVFSNDTYLFCNVSGIILGNKYAIDWLINICKNYNCEVVE